MSSTGTTRATGTGPYGLRRPGPADAHAAIVRVCGANAAPTWARLLAAADLSGREDERAALERLLAVMDTSADALVRLCAQPLRIRLASYDRLSAAHALMTPAGTP